MRIKLILKVIFVNSLILLIGVVSLEMFFGGWLSKSPINRINIIRATKYIFNISKIYRRKDVYVYYTRDAYGLRGSYTKPSSIDILSVGGSTTDQRYLDDKETWQYKLQQLFFSSGKKIVVANAGIDGQSTYGHIENFNRWFPHIPNLRPEYVLFYVGINDFYVNPKAYPDKFILYPEKKKNFILMIYENSALCHLYFKLRGIKMVFTHNISHRKVDFSNVSWTQQTMRDDYNKIMKKRLDAYYKRLNVLIDKTKEFGAIPIFITQPMRWYKLNNNIIVGSDEEIKYDDIVVNGMDYYYMMKKLNSVTMDVCRNKEGICIDLSDKSKAVWDDNDFYDYNHMTPKGAQKLAELLVEELKGLF